MIVPVYFAKFIKVFIKSRNLNRRITFLKIICKMSIFYHFSPHFCATRLVKKTNCNTAAEANALRI